jgi:hypothetical protein
MNKALYILSIGAVLALTACQDRDRPATQNQEGSAGSNPPATAAPGTTGSTARTPGDASTQSARPEQGATTPSPGASGTPMPGAAPGSSS